MGSLEKPPLERWLPFAWSAAAGLLVVGPWMRAGYIFATDFSGPRHYAFPIGPSSYEGLQFGLAVAGSIIPAELLGKIFIFIILFAAGLASYRCAPIGGVIPRMATSLVYVFNPFVYDRLAYGQLTVLAGYATLPWVASCVRSLLAEATFKRSALAAAALSIIAILDVHFAFLAVVLAGVLLLAHLAVNRPNVNHLARLGQGIAVTTAGFAVASSYWVIPVLLGFGPEARTLKTIGTADLRAFTTTADPRFGLVPNVLGLYGFWAEQTGRFASLKDFVPQWPLVLGAILAVGIAGVVVGLRRGGLNTSRSWMIGLGAAATFGLILSLGVANPYTAPLTNWLNVVFPPYRGMRDSGKWIALIALAYSQLFGLGVVALMDWLGDIPKPGAAKQIAFAGLTTFVLTMPLYYGSGVLYGMHGQIQPSTYPVGWFEADTLLTNDQQPGRAVFLPWHGYFALSFVRNTNRVVLNPARTFFSIPVVASQDLEIPGVMPPADPDQMAIARLVASAGQEEWAPTLTQLNIKYVLIAHEVDWESYGYLALEPELQLVHDYGSITIYRNLLWNHAKTGGNATCIEASLCGRSQSVDLTH